MEATENSNGTQVQNYDNAIIGNLIAATRGVITTFKPMVNNGQIVQALQSTPVKYLIAPKEKGAFSDTYLFVGADNQVYRKVYNLDAVGESKFSFIPVARMTQSKSGKTQEALINGLWMHVRNVDIDQLTAGTKKAVMITARKDALNTRFAPYTPDADAE